jgi:hypothetical protein
LGRLANKPLVGGFVCDGDSLTFGLVVSGNPAVNPYPAQLAGLTGKPAINIGQSGAFFTTVSGSSGFPHLDADYATHVASNYNSSTANILVVQGGINDIYHGATTADIDTAVRSYCAKGRATGFKVYLMTVTASNDFWNSGLETARLAVNTDRRTNWAAYCDGLIDVDANAAFSDPNNATYFQSDHLHWTTAADTIVANLVKTAVGL